MSDSFPVAEDDTLTVQCSNSTCGRTRTFDVYIFAESGVPAGNDWETRLTLREDGTATVIESYCSDHRLTDAIDDLEETTRRVTDSVCKAITAAEEVVNE